MNYPITQRQPIAPDHKYGSQEISKFINYMMKGGKKTTARKIVYDAMVQIADKTEDEPLKTFEAAVENVGPRMEGRGKRIGGATYQVPIEVRTERGTALGIRWIIRASRQRNDKSMATRLGRELIDASKNEGGAVRKKDETHRMAEANKAFAHFRF
jgi:small subunit ribosomal protein S7